MSDSGKFDSYGDLKEEERSGSEEEEEDDDEENSGSEDDDDEEDGSDEGSDQDDEDEDSDEDDKKKKKQHAIDDEEEKTLFKPSKYQSLITTLKDINRDLDDLSFTVEKVHTKFSPQKSKYTGSFGRRDSNVMRNYHPPTTQEEMRRSFSPRKQDYDDGGYDDGDHFNDRDGSDNRSYHPDFRPQRDQYQGGYQSDNSRRSAERAQPYPAKQVGFSDGRGNASFAQRQISPTSRFSNAPSTNYNKPGFQNQAPPVTSYTQFYRNQSALQQPMIYPQQQQQQFYGNNQAFYHPQLNSAPMGGINHTPQFGRTYNYGGVMNDQQSTRWKSSLMPAARDGEVQRVENLQEAIDALLR